jgi:urea transporter
MEAEIVTDQVVAAGDIDEEMPRPGLGDEIRAVVQRLRRLHPPKSTGFTDAVLRGLAQVVMQDNALTGLLIVVALCVNSFIYAAAAIFGAAVSTYTAMLLRTDRRLVRDGLYGFNGALTGIALLALTSHEAAHGDLPTPGMVLYIAMAAAFSTIVARAFAFFVHNDRLRGISLPYCVATLLLLGAVHQFSGTNIAAAAHPVVAGAGVSNYDGNTWLYGVTTGVSQIFLQDNWLTGLVIVAAIAVSSWITAVAVIAGSALGVVVGTLLGMSDGLIRSGVLGYNAALTAAALGGFFVVLNRAGVLFALLGALLTACVGVGLTMVFVPFGLPILTLPFVIITWLMLVAARGFPALRTIPPERATTPEATLEAIAFRQRAPAAEAD